MNPIDRLIAVFSPKTALARARARYALRAYEAASVGRRATSWRTWHSSQNAEMQLAIRPLRDRARDLVRNTPHGARMLEIIVSNSVGTGLQPVSTTGVDSIDRKVTDLWNDWKEHADISRVLTFDAMQALAVRSIAESGEVVLRFVDRRPEDVGAKVPFQLQLLEADFIDEFRDGIYQGSTFEGLTEETKRSRLGVGLGQFDAFTGLWLWPWHPGEITTYNLRPGISRFYARGEVLHVYRMLRPGQVRGVTWFAPIMTTARDYSDFTDAALVKARVEACFAGFIINSDDFEPVLDTIQGPGGSIADPNNPQATITNLEPGLLKELKTGQDIRFAQPTTTSHVETLMLCELMAMAAGANCTYDQLSGDLRQANYSSLRAGKLDFKQFISKFQQHTLIDMMCQPIWNRFINRAILVGQLRERRGGYPCEWVTPAWESVNPKFDQDAEERSVRAGRMSPQDFIASWGGDWRKMQDQHRAFFDRADKLGVVFDIDPRKMTRAGLAQKPPQPVGTGSGAPGMNGSGKPNGGANGSGETTDGQGGSTGLFDADGNEITPDDLTDMLDQAGAESPFRAVAAHLMVRDFDESEHPRDPDGRFTDKGGGDEGGGKPPSGGGATSAKPTARPKSGSKSATGFVSPNVKTSMTFDEAKEAIASGDQDRLGEISRYIDDKLGITSHNTNGIGAWADGAENSMIVRAPGATFEEMKVAMAMKGFLADQKAVVAFEPDAGGDHFVASFDAKGDLKTIHADLLNGGVQYHTLEPLAHGSVRVHVFGEDQATVDAIDKAAGRYGATPEIQWGHGEFIGTQADGTDAEQRADARAKYEEVIAAADNSSALAGRDIEGIWNDVRDRWAAISAGKGGDEKAGRGLTGTRDFDESEHPRDPDGKFTDKGSDEGGGKGPRTPAASAPAPSPKTTKPGNLPAPAATPAPPAASTAKPKQKELWPGKFPPIPEPGKKVEPEDFAKDKVDLRGDIAHDKDKAKKFADVWSEKIGEAPADFKKEFTGGLNTTMLVEHKYDDVHYDEPVNEMEFRGYMLDDDGARIGEYTRTIDFKANEASSDYFRLDNKAQGKDAGKKMLAANVAMYQKLGLDRVKVHANIDVGGYAWAKYGYVPSDSSWRSLRSDIMDNIDKLAGGSGYEASSWDELSSDMQENAERSWMEESFAEFHDSEVDSWRENGGDLAQAKTQLAENFADDHDWAWKRTLGNKYAITVGEGNDVTAKSIGPYLGGKGTSLEHVIANATVTFDDRRGDGSEDPDITIDDTKTPELTDDERQQIEEILVEVFNKEAESRAPDIDPPDFSDSVRDYQRDYWDQIDDGEKFKIAERLGYTESSDSGGDGEIDPEAADTLRELAGESDPKALWAIADSEHGKELLLGTDWYGSLDLHDEETIDRFNAYVAKGKSSAPKAAAG